MPFTLDPELAEMVGEAGTGAVWVLPRGDALALRNSIDTAEPDSPDVSAANSTSSVSTELYVRPGVPHGFDRIDLEISRRSWADRYRAIRAI